MTPVTLFGESRRQGRRRGLLAALSVAIMAIGSFAAAAQDAGPTLIEIVGKPSPALEAKPPVPDGSKPIPEDHEPTICTAGEFAAGASIYAPTYGYAWSKTAKAWVARPRCYPKWGFLHMSPSQIVQPGRPVTMVATPDEGSNSGQYAPVTGTISWNAPGMIMSGCGPSDLSCTILPNTTATTEWQWFEVHVSMPKTFYVDDPGEFCGGRHLCAGATTNAWAFIGIPPVKFKGEIYGKVTQSRCSKSGCTSEPAVGVVVEGRSKGKLVHGLTDRNGGYRLIVSKGKWSVKPVLEGHKFSPKSAKAKVKTARVGPYDFSTCATADSALDRQVEPQAGARCPSARIEVAFAGKPKSVADFSYQAVDFETDQPVSVFWDDEKVAEFSASAGRTPGAGFTSSLTRDRLFSHRGNIAETTSGEPACWGVLRAEQDGRSVVQNEGPALSSRLGHMVYSTLKAFRPGDYVCELEDKQIASAAAVSVVAIGKTGADASATEFVEIYRPASGKRRVAADTLADAPLCLDLGAAGGGHILLKSRKVSDHYEVAPVQKLTGSCPG